MRISHSNASKLRIIFAIKIVQDNHKKIDELVLN